MIFIICSGLLHEVEEPDKMIRDIFRLCGRETIVHINVPNANSIHRLVAKNGNNKRCTLLIHEK